MNLIFDTHPLIWAFTGDKRLSINAKNLAAKAEVIFLPTIVILEAVQVSQKFGFERDFREFLATVPSPKLQVLPLDMGIVNQYLTTSKILEIHDRPIVATASFYHLPIVTRDEEITRIYSDIIW